MRLARGARRVSMAAVSALIVAAGTARADLPPQLAQAGVSVFPSAAPRSGDGNAPRTRIIAQDASAAWVFAAPDTPWMWGIGAKADSIRFEAGKDGALLPDRLYDVAMPVGATRVLARGRRVDLFLLPGLHGDLRALSGRDVRVEGGGAYHVPVSAHAQIQIGALYATNFGRPRLFPTFGYAWKSALYRFRFVAPVRFEAWRAFGSGHEAGLVLGFRGGKYHLSETGPLQGETFAYTLGTFGPALRLHLPRGGRLDADAGVAFFRRREYFDGSSALRTVRDKASGFLRLGAGFVF